jgi:hypothetical protein
MCAQPLNDYIYKEATPMNEYPNFIKQNLNSIINEMAKEPALFVKNPGKDFSRNRKLPFETVIQLLISMGGNTIYKELLESQGYNINTVTTSAFIQQRDKILSSAFEFLLHRFTQAFHDTKEYRGYRLLAVDGSSLRIAHDPNNPDTYFQNNRGEKGFNLLHLNAMYDLCNKLYIDAMVQPRRLMNENKALIEMVERATITGNVIVIADRNYESYNIFAHIEEKGWNYLIRVKDINSNGILSALPMPLTGEFDISIKRILTNKHNNKEINAHPDIYKILPYRTKFDFFDANNFCPISFRVVRFKITDDSYETVITNLNQSDFPPDEIREIYKKRWKIETSFNELKYVIGLTSFHAKKQEYIIQEIFARIIMYNFALMITSHVIISQTDTRHFYQVNFTVAIHICRNFLRSWNNAPPPDVEAMIRKNILPVRPGRKYERKIDSRKVVDFNYRVA